MSKQPPAQGTKVRRFGRPRAAPGDRPFDFSRLRAPDVTAEDPDRYDQVRAISSGRQTREGIFHSLGLDFDGPYLNVQLFEEGGDDLEEDETEVGASNITHVLLRGHAHLWQKVIFCPVKSMGAFETAQSAMDSLCPRSPTARLSDSRGPNTPPAGDAALARSLATQPGTDFSWAGGEENRKMVGEAKEMGMVVGDPKQCAILYDMYASGMEGVSTPRYDRGGHPLGETERNRLRKVNRNESRLCVLGLSDKDKPGKKGGGGAKQKDGGGAKRKKKATGPAERRVQQRRGEPKEGDAEKPTGEPKEGDAEKPITAQAAYKKKSRSKGASLLQDTDENREKARAAGFPEGWLAAKKGDSHWLLKGPDGNIYTSITEAKDAAGVQRHKPVPLAKQCRAPGCTKRYQDGRGDNRRCRSCYRQQQKAAAAAAAPHATITPPPASTGPSMAGALPPPASGGLGTGAAATPRRKSPAELLATDAARALALAVGLPDGWAAIRPDNGRNYTIVSPTGKRYYTLSEACENAGVEFVKLQKEVREQRQEHYLRLIVARTPASSSTPANVDLRLAESDVSTAPDASTSRPAGNAVADPEALNFVGAADGRPVGNADVSESDDLDLGGGGGEVDYDALAESFSGADNEVANNGAGLQNEADPAEGAGLQNEADPAAGAGLQDEADPAAGAGDENEAASVADDAPRTITLVGFSGEQTVKIGQRAGYQHFFIGESDLAVLPQETGIVYYDTTVPFRQLRRPSVDDYEGSCRRRRERNAKEAQVRDQADLTESFATCAIL